MLKDSIYRWIIIFSVLVGSLFLIKPSFETYILSQKNDKAINLGLDLQGGMYILLEVDVPTLVRKKFKYNELVLAAIDQAQNLSNINESSIFFSEFLSIANNNSIKLKKYYKELSLKDNEAVVQELIIQRDKAIASALQIMRNRIDKFGVAEPTISRLGENRISIELPGVQDSNRARNLIEQTASLEFYLVYDFYRYQDKWESVLNMLDNYILNDNAINSYYMKVTRKNIGISDSVNSVQDLLLLDGSGLNSFLTKDEDLKDRPFSAFLNEDLGYSVLSEEYEMVKDILDHPEIQRKISSTGKLLWSNEFITSSNFEMGAPLLYRQLYLVKSKPEIEGNMIKEPKATMGGVGSDNTGRWVVNLSMNREGTKKWSRFTGSNVGRQVAIVLDNQVFMAPPIGEKIPNGQTQISGFENGSEAEDIENVLRAGELPAPVKIIQESTVGPSLGSDSIKSGRQAMLIGLICVMVFMIIYYKGAGLLSTVALILNLIMVLAILGGLNATLTLPGIAGLILTIGMSVDANVIIFERIREELKIGKTVRAAINSGYNRAFITILDANITTLIAALVLASVGSGPIKGFAITLSAGIICSMFTAVFVTKSIFMFFSDRKVLKRLSI